MKKLLLTMIAVLFVNISYAADVGEDLKGECKYQVQSSRNQEKVDKKRPEREREDRSKGARSVRR